MIFLLPTQTEDIAAPEQPAEGWIGNDSSKQ